jgi:hypothetical protein
MENTNTATLKQLWRTTFADNFSDRPRLQRALKDNDVFFTMQNDILNITFYVVNEVQKQWIQINVKDELLEQFKRQSGVKSIELKVLSENDLPF